MKPRTLALSLAVACTLGCREPADHADDAHHHATEIVADVHDEHADEGLLRIAPEMLRDLRLTTRPAELRPRGDGATALGELRVDENHYAEVGSPIAARVVVLDAGPGDRVVADQPLATLQSVEVGRARADYLAAQAEAQLARRAVERKRRLARENIVPQRELQEAEAGDAAAQARLQSTRALLSALGVAETSSATDSAAFSLRAPIAGTVLERSAVRGQTVDPAQPLFRIADTSTLWLMVHAFERDALRVPPGAPVRITFAALPGQTFSGTVAVVGQQVDVASRTVPIRIDVKNESGKLRPGMSATAWLPLGGDAEQIVAVPAAAVQRLADGWHVFIPRGEGTFEMRTVGRGRDLGGEVEILSGLNPDEAVIVDGAFLLKAEAEKSRGEGDHHAH